MNKQLMWFSAVVNDDFHQKMAKICLNNNLDLSDRFFRFPLHISLKRTFYTDNFEEVKNDLKSLINDLTPIIISETYLFCNKDMLWLRFKDETQLIDIHKIIDQFLYDRYQIPIDEFDKNYVPHITLFRDDDENKIIEMFNLVKDKIPDLSDEIYRFAIGSKLEGNEFYIVKNGEN